MNREEYERTRQYQQARVRAQFKPHNGYWTLLIWAAVGSAPFLLPAILSLLMNSR